MINTYNTYGNSNQQQRAFDSSGSHTCMAEHYADRQARDRQVPDPHQVLRVQWNDREDIIPWTDERPW